MLVQTTRHISAWLMGLLLVGALSGCASLPDNISRQASTALTDVQDTRLARKHTERGAGRAPDESEFLLLNDGLDAFVARAALARLAERSIDSQYYMVHGDEVGKLYLNSLLEAADRGVRVRFLVDDIDQGDRDFGLGLIDMHPNIEMRIFNPFGRNTGRIPQYLTGFGKQTRRAHNKSMTVDNIATILGGRNIGDEYFSADPELAFSDLDVLAIGPVARDVSVSFDDYWNSPLSYPISSLLDKQPTAEEYRQARQRFKDYIAGQQDSAYLQRLANSDLANMLGEGGVTFEWGSGQVFADPSSKLQVKTGEEEYQMITELRPQLNSASSELIIFSPYFVPGKDGTKTLVALVKRGVRVRILTNSLASTDVGVVHAGYVRYRNALLRGGVELYELNKILSEEQLEAIREGEIGMSKSSLHAKCFVIDRQRSFIGSLNLDPRSVVQNTEIGVLVESPPIAQNIADAFDQRIDDVAFRLQLTTDEEGIEHLEWHGIVNGKPAILTREPYTGFWQRFVIGLLRFMPIESQI
jgi:putative cardiolipin synthase